MNRIEWDIKENWEGRKSGRGFIGDLMLFDIKTVPEYFETEGDFKREGKILLYTYLPGFCGFRCSDSDGNTMYQYNVICKTVEEAMEEANEMLLVFARKLYTKSELFEVLL